MFIDSYIKFLKIGDKKGSKNGYYLLFMNNIACGIYTEDERLAEIIIIFAQLDDGQSHHMIPVRLIGIILDEIELNN